MYSFFGPVIVHVFTIIGVDIITNDVTGFVHKILFKKNMPTDTTFTLFTFYLEKIITITYHCYPFKPSNRYL